MKPFYMVYSPEGAMPPKKRYPDWGKAAFDADLMASRYPSQEFFVLKAVAHWKAEVKVVHSILQCD